VTKTLQTGKPQYVTLGNGDRIWGGAPGSRSSVFLPQRQARPSDGRAEKTHAAGLRYPIPQYMNFSPGSSHHLKKPPWIGRAARSGKSLNGLRAAFCNPAGSRVLCLDQIVFSL
jgi:hypothetical protein